MKTNKKITAASLLDFLMRDRELVGFINQHDVSVSSFDPGQVTLGYYLQEQTDDDMREVMLWSEDMYAEEFMVEFSIVRLEDLGKITVEDLWLRYRVDRAYITVFNGEDDVDMRIGDGVKTLEEALVYGMRAMSEDKE
ncbi:hypothetical protein [Pedobacter frigoris]|uniref:hypothetical protein n=1 Tax=Pedobacter frigoris TaxID=2571272 RepID=UPI0029301538|nr:hypothetical protein [Pedobacter frigoris]